MRHTKKKEKVWLGVKDLSVCTVYNVFILYFPADVQVEKEDTLVLKLGSLSMAPQADNPLTRTVLRKDIYQ